jgi:hypothetical protein
MDFHYDLDDALVHQVNANTWFLDLDTDLEGSMIRIVSEILGDESGINF